MAELTVLFDGYCGMCTRSMDAVKRVDRADRIELVANQVPEVREKYGLTKEMVDYQVWAIDAAGRRIGGAQAIAAIVDVLLGQRSGVRGVLARTTSVPGISHAIDALYQWVARNRRHFPGTTPWCERHAGECR